MNLIALFSFNCRDFCILVLTANLEECGSSQSSRITTLALAPCTILTKENTDSTNIHCAVMSKMRKSVLTVVRGKKGKYSLQTKDLLPLQLHLLVFCKIGFPNTFKTLYVKVPNKINACVIVHNPTQLNCKDLTLIKPSEHSKGTLKCNAFTILLEHQSLGSFLTSCSDSDSGVQHVNSIRAIWTVVILLRASTSCVFSAHCSSKMARQNSTKAKRSLSSCCTTPSDRPPLWRRQKKAHEKL